MDERRFADEVLCALPSQGAEVNGALKSRLELAIQSMRSSVYSTPSNQCGWENQFRDLFDLLVLRGYLIAETSLACCGASFYDFWDFRAWLTSTPLLSHKFDRRCVLG